MKCIDCKNHICCDTEVFNYGYEENKAEECPIFIKKEYADTMDNIIEYLQNEKDRRLNAVNSGMFSDNWTSIRHCLLIDAALDAIKEKERQIRKYEKHFNYDKEKMLNPEKYMEV